MTVPKRFEAPLIWRLRFAAFARRNGAPQDYAKFDAAANLAAEFYDPASLKVLQEMPNGPYRSSMGAVLESFQQCGCVSKRHGRR